MIKEREGMKLLILFIGITWGEILLPNGGMKDSIGWNNWDRLGNFIDMFPYGKIFNAEGKEESNFTRLGKVAYFGTMPREWWVWDPVEIGHERVVEGFLVKTMMLSPRAFAVSGILSHEECEDLISLAEPNLTRSTTINPQNSSQPLMFQDRTSHQTWMEEEEGSTAFLLRQRILKILRLPEWLDQDPLQVARYEKGEHYHGHVDCFPSGERRNRFVSVVTLLQPALKGGLLTFPQAEGRKRKDFISCEGVAVELRQGDALFFYDLLPPFHMSGRVDENSLHMSCDVEEGVKWSATKFIYNLPKNWKRRTDFLGGAK